MMPKTDDENYLTEELVENKKIPNCLMTPLSRPISKF